MVAIEGCRKAHRPARFVALRSTVLFSRVATLACFCAGARFSDRRRPAQQQFVLGQPIRTPEQGSHVAQPNSNGGNPFGEAS